MTLLPAKDPKRFAETRIGEEVVVMNLATGDFFSLTGTAAAVWELLDGRPEHESTVAELADRFSASPDEVRADLDTFIAELAQAGLLAGQ